MADTNGAFNSNADLKPLELELNSRIRKGFFPGGTGVLLVDNEILVAVIG
jgi:hypothetical protein